MTIPSILIAEKPLGLEEALTALEDTHQTLRRSTTIPAWRAFGHHLWRDSTHPGGELAHKHGAGRLVYCNGENSTLDSNRRRSPRRRPSGFRRALRLDASVVRPLCCG